MPMKPIVIEGRVDHGRQLGREIGFPTANLPLPAGLEVEDGVYAAWAEVEGVRYDAMSNVGENPSVGATRRRLETHLFDFEGSLYGERLRVTLLHRIREERTFATLDALTAQIVRDRETVRNYLAHCGQSAASL